MDKTNEPEADTLAQRIQNRAAGRIQKLLADAQGEVAPKELWNMMWGDSVSKDGFVATVDPSDMKNVCRMGREGQASAMGMSALSSVCSPAANVTAIWYRVQMLGLCGELLTPFMKDGELSDVVFRVAATFPMRRMEVDVTYQGPPFDTEELPEIQQN